MRARSWQMTEAGDAGKRWDTDSRLEGVADASVFAAALEELAVLARRPGWVTEEPGVHLVPHLRDANVAGLRLPHNRVRDDGVLDGAAEYNPRGNPRHIPRRGMARIGGLPPPPARRRGHPDTGPPP